MHTPTPTTHYQSQTYTPLSSMLALIPSLVLLFQPTAYFHCSSMLAPRNPLTKLAIWSASWASLSVFCASWQAILCHCRIVIVSREDVGLWAIGEWLDEVVRSYSAEEMKLVQSKLAKKDKGERPHAGSSAVILHDTTVVVHRSRINTVSRVCRLLVFHICIFLDLFLRQCQHCLHPVQQHRQVHWHRMKRVCVSVECGEMKKVEDRPL